MCHLHSILFRVSVQHKRFMFLFRPFFMFLNYFSENFLFPFERKICGEPYNSWRKSFFHGVYWLNFLLVWFQLKIFLNVQTVIFFEFPVTKSKIESFSRLSVCRSFLLPLNFRRRLLVILFNLKDISTQFNCENNGRFKSRRICYRENHWWACSESESEWKMVVKMSWK